MKINQEYDHPLESTGADRARWVENPNPEYAGLWVVVKFFLAIFLAFHSIPLLFSLILGLTHPLTLFNIGLLFFVPTIVLVSAIFRSKGEEPDDLYISNLSAWMLRLLIAFGANIAITISIDLGAFPFIFSALLISCIVIELLAYLTYRSYSDDMIREIIEERKMLSPVNENNEFWFLTRGGDVGS
ncbi:hypothetical protein, partial [Nitrincola nitratireducens]|uniref:hypothetical protein n=2 Tax=Nitrincola TaxID=267849 RepID=UPI00055B398D